MTANNATDRDASPQTQQPARTYAQYVPHDLKYNADFEDSLMQAILQPSSGDDDRTTTKAQNSTEQSSESTTVQPSTQNHLLISENELPLPLDDPRRTLPSRLPGINLTHPGGYLEGGPGLDPTLDTFSDDFLSANPRIKTSDQLRRAVDKEIASSIEALRARMRARKAAKEKNERLEKELRTLTDQHGMEVRIRSRMQEEMVRKKEAREKRRMKKEEG